MLPMLFPQVIQHTRSELYWLVVYLYTPLVVSTPLKNMSSSVGITVPNIWNDKKCSKPPTSISTSYHSPKITVFSSSLLGLGRSSGIDGGGSVTLWAQPAHALTESQYRGPTNPKRFHVKPQLNTYCTYLYFICKAFEAMVEAFLKKRLGHYKVVPHS